MVKYTQSNLIASVKMLNIGVIRRVARIWKRGGGFFERVRKVQTTLTRIFIALESESHGLSENWDEISRKAWKFKRFFSPKTGGLQKLKKKGLHRNWDWFFGQNRKFKRFFRPNHDMYFTTSAPNFLWGCCFQFFTKNRPQKHQKRAILDTSHANGGARAPSAPPDYATGCHQQIYHKLRNRVGLFSIS